MKLNKTDIKQIRENVWEIPAAGEMRVPEEYIYQKKCSKEQWKMKMLCSR